MAEKKQASRGANGTQGVISGCASESKIVVYIANLIGIAILLAQNFTVTGAVVSGGILLALALCMASKHKVMSTIVYLPIIALADIGCMGAIYLDALDWAKDVSVLSEMMDVLTGNADSMVILCIVILAVFGFLNKKLIVLSSVSGLLIGAIFIFESYGQGDFQTFSLSTQGEDVLRAFLVCMVVWAITLQMIAHTAPKKGVRTVLIGLALLLFFCGDLYANGGQFFQGNLAWLTYVDILLSAWGYLVVGVVLGLFILLRVMEDAFSVDAFGLLMFGTALLGAKLCLREPSTAQWVLLFIVICGTYFSMIKDERYDEICGLDVNDYIVAQFFAFLGFVVLLQHGLWLNALFTALFLGIFIACRKNPKGTMKRVHLWLVFVWGIFAEGVAFLCISSFPAEKLYVMISMLVVTIGALCAVNVEQMAGRSVPKRFNATVCACFALLVGLLVR